MTERRKSSKLKSGVSKEALTSRSPEILAIVRFLARRAAEQDLVEALEVSKRKQTTQNRKPGKSKR